MADTKISALTGASTPLAGTEVLPIVQSGATVKVAVSNLTAGRAVSALSLTSTNDATINGLTVGKGLAAVTTNTAVGVSALAANTSGSSSTAVGYQAGIANTTGDVTLLGYRAGYANTTSSNLTAIGVSAAQANISGSANTAVGKLALSVNSTGIQNTAVGYLAGQNATGNNNVFLGQGAGSAVTSGGQNVIIGRYSGSAAPISATGSNFVVLSDGDGNVRMYFTGANATFKGTISPVQATTAGAPAYVKGAMYFDTTLNKLRIGGATDWETVTSV